MWDKKIRNDGYIISENKVFYVIKNKLRLKDFQLILERVEKFNVVQKGVNVGH